MLTFNIFLVQLPVIEIIRCVIGLAQPVIVNLVKFLPKEKGFPVIYMSVLRY